MSIERTEEGRRIDAIVKRRTRSLEAERDRLREALQAIKEAGMHRAACAYCFDRDLSAIRALAHTALSEEEKDD
jgi:hypothetical protein